jgi:hypothetical protein
MRVAMLAMSVHAPTLHRERSSIALPAAKNSCGSKGEGRRGGEVRQREGGWLSKGREEGCKLRRVREGRGVRAWMSLVLGTMFLDVRANSFRRRYIYSTWHT